ncbi:MAG: glutathione synthase [Ruminococcus sp.]|nr:glutathione synthase [Ruminococcus sp.]
MRYDPANIDKTLLFEGGFGLERETLRVTAEGTLSQTLHPYGDDPHLSRDFCENQLEIITSVAHSPAEAVQLLAEQHKRAAAVLKERGEYLWPFSNPPRYNSEEDIPVAQFDGQLKNKQLYRMYLAKKYGKRNMLFSGIHLNFSFAPELADKLSRGSSKDELYLTLAARLALHSWLIVLLTAASSVYDSGFISEQGEYASPRCSEIGYWNDFTPSLDYSSLYAYCKSIQDYVNDGKLVSASELYYPIRLKPRGENSLEALLEGGIDHIELRMYDLDPLAPYGIFEEDIEFAQLLILYLISLDLPLPDRMAQEHGIEKMKRAAHYDISPELKSEALALLDRMTAYFCTLGEDRRKLDIIRLQKEKLTSGKRYAERVRESFGDDFNAQAFERSKQFTLGE